MFITGMDISDFPGRFADVYNLDTWEKVKCIWADDVKGEYCEYIRDEEGKKEAIKNFGMAFIPMKRIRYGNIKIIDIRKERFEDGKVITMHEEEAIQITEILRQEEKELLDAAMKDGEIIEFGSPEYTKHP